MKIMKLYEEMAHALLQSLLFIMIRQKDMFNRGDIFVFIMMVGK